MIQFLQKDVEVIYVLQMEWTWGVPKVCIVSSLNFVSHHAGSGL